MDTRGCVSDHPNLYMEKLVSALSAVSRPESSTNIEPFPLTRLIHRFPRFFLAYNGSLTTPPCAETVSWVIHQEPAVLSKRQMQEFRNLLNHEGRQISNNYRPLQPLNGRTVLHIR
uniref:Alpha-carbonic anhydrase domain-containing protein n=1 Tax=Timema bartmani TaxID=61472 RepID=A0A7R9FDH1_9NEOP|nr:unnamed protein product [Timema bartmani]